MTFPLVTERPGSTYPDLIRSVRIGPEVTGFTHSNGDANLNLHTKGRKVRAEYLDVAPGFATVVIRSNDTEVHIYLHDVRDAEALLEAVEAAFHALRKHAAVDGLTTRP